jgi:opacity protein-like surface antigen
MRSRRLWPTVALILGLLLGTRSLFADASHIALTAPASLVGDGEASGTVSVTADPPDLAGAPSDLKIAVSAGTIRAVRIAAPGRFELDYVPPRVARETTVRIEVGTAAGGLAPGRATIRVTRPTQAVDKATGGPLDLHVPAAMVLGSDSRGNISTRKLGSDTVVLQVNVGTVSELREGPDGRLHATYEPPTDKFPHIAIVTAMTLGGSLIDWTTIALLGTPQVKATTDPSAMVRARVGTLFFGPFHADASGQTNIDVLAPPGETAAEILATDARGEHALRLPLGAPPFDHAFAVCVPDDERAFLFAVDDAGEAKPGLAYRITSSRGAAGRPVATSAGAYEWRLDIPEDAVRGQPIAVEATVGGDKKRYGAKCSCPALGEPPTGIDLRLDPPAYVAGSGRPVEIVATLRYAGKRRPRSTVLDFTATTGKVGETSQRSPTEIVASWQPPEAFGEAREARARVRTRTRPEIVSEAPLPLRPGPVARLSVVAPRVGVVAVTAFDAFGNQGASAKLAAQARGTVGVLRRERTGVYTATYARPDDETTSDDIFVQDLDTKVRTSQRIDILRPIRWISASARVGYVTNVARVHSLMGAAGVSSRLPWQERTIAVGLEAAYWGNGSNVTDARTGEQARVSVAVVPLTLRLSLEQPIGKVAPYAGGGVAAVFVRTGLSSPSLGELSRKSTVFGAMGFAGASTRLGPGRAGAEVGYLSAKIDDGITSGNSGGWQLTAGYRLNLR